MAARNPFKKEAAEEAQEIINTQPPILCIDNLRQAHAADLQFLLDWRKADKPLSNEFYQKLNMKYLWPLKPINTTFTARMTKPQLLQYLLDTNDPTPEETMEKIWNHPFNSLVIDLGQLTMHQFVHHRGSTTETAKWVNTLVKTEFYFQFIYGLMNMKGQSTGRRAFFT